MNQDYMRVALNFASFATESGRLQTFTRWTNPAVMPEDLAKAGFVHAYDDDKVQCVYCKGVLGYWEPGDIPLEEHRKFFPRCPLVIAGTPLTQPLLLPRGEDVAGTGLPPKASQARKKSVIINKNVIPHHASKHPKYGSLESRVQSFGEWPVHIYLPRPVKHMARAGFFYTGTNDAVTCFHCGQCLKEWEENDDPWEEHARWQPMCEFILLKKGQVYVEKVQRKVSTSTEIKENDPVRMEVAQSEVAKAIKDQKTPPHFSDIVLQLTENTKSSSESPTASNDLGPLAEPDDTKQQELRSCIICTVQERCVTFLPCGHFSTCTDCTLLLNNCPVCRVPIDTVVKTYMS